MIPLSTILSMAYYVTTGWVFPPYHHDCLSLRPHTEIILIASVCVSRCGDIIILSCATADAVRNIIIYYNIFAYDNIILLQHYVCGMFATGTDLERIRKCTQLTTGHVNPATGHSSAIPFNDAAAYVLAIGLIRRY